ncbi:hypothetical protein [Streptomyces sp. XY431]|uniref:hypothetical protein n=1 Tax=Streptomyces sp. XY431 TaxID=1415562 RepID=UPI0006AF0A57|nr:hypothetical protein [Streptomyces sp. XY431]
MTQNLTSWQPGPTITPLVPAQPPQIMSAGAYLASRYGGRIVPALSTSTALILARIWHTQGAAGSYGDAALMIALAAGSTLHGIISASKQNGHEVITAVAFAASGAFALVGVAAYTASWALAAIVWLVATVLVYSVSARHWRAASEHAEQRYHELQLTQVNRLADVQIAQVERDTTAQALAYGLALQAAIEQRQALDPRTFQLQAVAAAGLPQLAQGQQDR